MEILNKLPLDLQEKVLEEYVKYEKLRALVRNYPIEFTLCFENKRMIRGEIQKNYFQLSSKIWCDDCNLVKANFDIHWSSWTGWSYNLRNVPLGYVYETNCFEIIGIWKKAFYEYLRFNHLHGKPSFEKAKIMGYSVNCFFVGKNSVETWNTDTLHSKTLAKMVKRAWFGADINDILRVKKKLKEIDLDGFDCVNINPERFRMDDSCPDLGSDFIRVPYTVDDLNMIIDKMPFIYECLEKYDELWSPRLNLSDGMKRYINLYNWFHESPNTLPPYESFNQLVRDVITKDLNIEWYSFAYDYYSKYIEMPKIHEILNYFS